MIKTFKYKLRPNKEQARRLSNWIGVCRTIYNLAKEVSDESYKKIGKTLSAYDLQAQVIEVKKDYEWMRKLPKDTLVEPVFRFDKARKRFFKGSGYPRWARKEKYNTLVFIQQNKTGLRISGNKIHLHKIGWIKFFNSRSIEGNIKQVSVTKKYNGWFMSVMVDVKIKHLPKNNNSIGIDLGINHLAVTSNGEFIDNPKIFKKYEKELRIINRSFARKKKGSVGFNESKRKAQKIHDKIKNTRNDYLQKVTSRIISENQVIIMEDLKVSNMIRDKYFAKSIADVAWTSMTDMLDYKSEWYGRTLKKVNPKYTSRDCSVCGYRVDKMPLSIRKWTCPECKTNHNRDHNAARNIKQRAGLALVS